ncbi:MAG: Flagellar biosynthesis protein FliO [Cyanobacteria bacterium RYN_339]|nr:Flagellar biosynthesis protein FliO [Cyanobacteria bacterium RYN_339]
MVDLAATATPYVMPTLAPFTSPPEIAIWPYLLQLIVFTGLLAAGSFFGLRYLKDKIPGLSAGLGLSSATGLKVIDRVAVDARRTVFVVAMGKRSWLLASSDHHITTVAELDPEDLGSAFESLVSKETNRREPPQT